MALGVGGVFGWIVARGDVAPVFVGPEPCFGVGKDVLADDVDDLLGEFFDDDGLILRFVVGRRFDHGAGMGFVVPLAGGVTECKDDFGAGAIG